MVWMARGVHHVQRHEYHQDGIHAVITETLGRFIADDVKNAGRHSICLQGGSAIFRSGHKQDLFWRPCDASPAYGKTARMSRPERCAIPAAPAPLPPSSRTSQ